MSCEARWKVEGSLYRGLTSIYFEFTSKLLHRCESREIYLLISWIFLYANLIRTDMMRNRLKDKAMYWLWRTLVLTMRITSVTENSSYYFYHSPCLPLLRVCVHAYVYAGAVCGRAWVHILIQPLSCWTYSNTRKLRYFADDIFEFNFVNVNCCTLIQISLKFVFVSPKLVYTSTVTDNGLVANWWQAIIWPNAGIVYWRMYASLGLNELDSLCEDQCFSHVIFFHNSTVYVIDVNPWSVFRDRLKWFQKQTCGLCECIF